MNTLRDIALFRSRRFTPLLPEQAQVNPGVYGAELAYWLCTELARSGVVTSYPIAEDWGWFVEYNTAAGAAFAVHCGNVDGTDDQWLLSLRRFGRKLFGRDKPPCVEAAPLIRAIETLLRAEESVTELTWLYGAASDPHV
jgi:hypothetical protein